MACAPSEESDQPGHLPAAVWSVSSLSAWRKLGSLATHYAHSEDSDQTDLSLCWTHSHFVGFVMRRLISHYCYTSLMKIQQIKKFCSIKEQPCTNQKLFFHMHKQMLICWVIWNECCFCKLSTDFLKWWKNMPCIQSILVTAILA